MEGIKGSITLTSSIAVWLTRVESFLWEPEPQNSIEMLKLSTQPVPVKGLTPNPLYKTRWIQKSLLLYTKYKFISASAPLKMSNDPQKGRLSTQYHLIGYFLLNCSAFTPFPPIQHTFFPVGMSLTRICLMTGSLTKVTKLLFQSKIFAVKLQSIPTQWAGL